MSNGQQNWYFTAETNANGLTYIKAYQTKWDPVRKITRRSAKRYVGRLYDDGRVKPSEGFLKAFPQYAGFPLYFSADKRLVDEATYKGDFPDSLGPKANPEDVERDDMLHIGVTWAAETLAESSGLYGSLADVFGREDARDLLHLAIYKLDASSSMAAYREWNCGVYLKHTKPLGDQRISELLGKVDEKRFEDFFQRRHVAKLQNTKGTHLTYALDNTSISTYSEMIPVAEYGHAKRDPDLKQINYTFVCDQADGEIVFAHAYEGSVNDVTALKTILYRMQAAKLELDNVVLVHDRGYSSLLNVQKLINQEIKFVQGVRLVEGAIRDKFDAYSESLRNVAFYDAECGVYARTYEEPWKQDTDSGQVTQKVFVHLYRYPGEDEAAMADIVRKVEEVLKAKKERRSVSPELWSACRPFLKEHQDAAGKTAWLRDDDAISKTVRYEGRFVIRSNVEPNPFAALKIYRMRNVVEQDFNQFKNWVDGARMRCTGKTYLGRLLVCTIAASLRLMMLQRAKRNAAGSDVKIPKNSLDVLMTILRKIRAERRRDGNAWVVRTLTKKQRDMLALLGLANPPRTLR